MDNQHRQIKGYRELSQQDIDLMNEIKAKGEEFEQVLQRVRNRLHAQKIDADNAADTGAMEEKQRLELAEPGHWLAIARTDIQTGIMAAVRAVAQPTSF